jgi:hypothetical protein
MIWNQPYGSLKVIQRNLPLKTFISFKQRRQIYRPVRIGIEFSNKVISWRKYNSLGYVTAKKYRSIVRKAKQRGVNLDDWYCSFNNMPCKDWIVIEQYVRGDWIDIVECYQGRLTYALLRWMLNPEL